MDPIFNPAKIEDYQYIADLYNDPNNSRYLLRGFVTPAQLLKVAGRLDFIVKGWNNDTLGWVGLFPQKNDGTVRTALIVESHLHGQGLGKKFVDFAIREAARLGYKRIELDVHEENAAAVHIYKKAGFKKQHASVRYQKII